MVFRNKSRLAAVFILNSLACQLFGSFEKQALKQLPFYPETSSKALGSTVSFVSTESAQSPIAAAAQKESRREASLSFRRSEAVRSSLRQMSQKQSSSFLDSNELIDSLERAALIKNASSKSFPRTPMLAVSQNQQQMPLREASLGSPLSEVVPSFYLQQNDYRVNPRRSQEFVSPFPLAYVIKLKNNSNYFITLESLEARETVADGSFVPCETFWTEGQDRAIETKKTSFLLKVERLGVKDVCCFSGLLVCSPQKNDNVVLEIGENGLIKTLQNCSVSRYR